MDDESLYDFPALFLRGPLIPDGFALPICFYNVRRKKTSLSFNTCGYGGTKYYGRVIETWT